MYEFENIKWKVFLKANSEKSAKILISRICKNIKCEPCVKSIEKYWKDKSLYIVLFQTQLNADSIKDAVFETLKICGSISSHWNITTPSVYSNNKWEFNGTTNGTSLAGVEFMDFHVSNFTEESKDWAE